MGSPDLEHGGESRWTNTMCGQALTSRTQWTRPLGCPQSSAKAAAARGQREGEDSG